MIIKKFVPCIYLYHEHAVRNLTDTTIVDTDPVRLADYYCEHNADELIVFDMSEGDAEHEAALDIIKEICAKAEVDVIGAGNVKRMEDIKKLLYAGCKKAVLDYEKESNIEITEEVSLKFGKEKILISYNDPAVLELHKEKIEKYVSAMILMNPHQIRETQSILSLPFFVQINQVALNKLLEIFAYENVCGVTGNTINDNVKEIVALKDLCRENDIPIESFQAAYKWLAETDLDNTPAGSYPICEGVTANVQEYTTFPASEGSFETHDKFFDIQYVISGKEQFGVCKREGLVLKEDHPENDLKFYEEPAMSGTVLLLPGDMIVVAPEDAHKPRCAAGEPEFVRKVVVKVKV